MAHPALFPALFEAQNYPAMFGDLLAADPNLRARVNEEIQWARQTLKKNDRIVWFLRFVRVELAILLKREGETPQDAKLRQQGELQRLSKRLGVQYSANDLESIRTLKRELTHFLALPVPAIQQVVWDRQSPRQLIQDFVHLEEQARAVADDDAGAADMAAKGRLIERDPGDQIIIRCPDGLCWVDLERGTCSAEAKAMGHCGNAGMVTGDNILSLRRPVKYRGEDYWYPVLTFIIDRAGYLGEMKGRSNDKPAEKYHPDIILLLRSDFVTGIKGGGYAPENNFSMNDLDRDEREELIAEKPLLGGLEHIYAKEGMSKRVLAMLNDQLDSLGISNPERYDAEAKIFVVESWQDFERFLYDIEDYKSDIKTLYAIATGEDDEAVGDPQEEFLSMVDALPEPWQDKIMERAGRSDGDLQAAARALMHQHDDWYQLFEDIVQDAHGRQPIAWQRLDEYNDEYYFSRFKCHAVYTNLPHKESLRDWLASNPRIELMVSERDMVTIASSSDDDYDEYDRYSLRYDGWAAQEDGYDRRYELKQAGLMDSEGRDTWLAGDGGADAEGLAEQFMQAVHGRQTPRVDDPRQGELHFGESLDRLRHLSGLSARQ